MANPRIDELRKRLEKEPGSRLFAQLAEELRKDGDLDGAVRVCREGLQKHANYPSARMTLGRALFDMGELAGARDEFVAVLKGAPDNILASRMLAEAHEGLGDVEAARAQFQKTLALAPGDKVAAARLQALGAGPGGGAAASPVPAARPGAPATAAPVPAPRPAAVAAPAVAPPPTVAPPKAPSPGSLPPTPSRSMPPAKPPQAGPAPAASVVAAALARAAAAKSQPPKPVPPPFASPAAAAPEPAPIPLVAAEESFELERPHEAPPVSFAGGDEQTLALTSKELAEAAAGVREGGPEAIPLVAAEEEFELERPYEAAPVSFTAVEPAAAAGTVEKAPSPEEVEAAPIPLVAAEEEFELERPYEAPPVGFTDEVSGATQPLKRSDLQLPSAEEVLDFDEAPTVSDVPAYKLEAVSPVRVEPEVEIEESRPETIPFADRPAEAEIPRPGAPAPAVEAVSEEIASVTLAELYYDQGFPEKALEVYRTLLARDPGHERARARVAEIEALARGPALETPAEPAVSEPIPAADARVARRATIERTIARLEAMLSVTRKE